MCLPTTAQGHISLRAKVLILETRDSQINMCLQTQATPLRQKNNKVQAMKDADTDKQ